MQSCNYKPVQNRAWSSSAVLYIPSSSDTSCVLTHEMYVEVAWWMHVYKIQFLIIIEVILFLFLKFSLFIYVSVPLYKHTHLEIDINAKSDRIEWGHARYQSVYRADRAFELVVQWVTASGTIVADLVSTLSNISTCTSIAELVSIMLVPVTVTRLAVWLADGTHMFTDFFR